MVQYTPWQSLSENKQLLELQRAYRRDHTYYCTQHRFTSLQRPFLHFPLPRTGKAVLFRIWAAHIAAYTGLGALPMMSHGSESCDPSCDPPYPEVLGIFLTTCSWPEWRWGVKEKVGMSCRGQYSKPLLYLHGIFTVTSCRLWTCYTRPKKRSSLYTGRV